MPANRQTEVIQYLKKNITNFKDIAERDNEYARCDAETPNYRIEIKTRGASDPTRYTDGTIIEHKKAAHNEAKCMETGKEFIYAVLCGSELYLWNITRMRKNGYDFDWQDKMCNATTNVRDSKGEMGRKINKKIGLLDWKQARIQVNIKTNKITLGEKKCAKPIEPMKTQ